jgi:hypothetical protein
MLQATSFTRFPGGSIRPQGWLRQQLRLQADGLSGHLDEFWPDIRDSAWIGGDADGWERMPYWLDGVIPLAWILDDEALKQRIKGYIGYIVEHQSEDGWLGPRVSDSPEAADYWSQFLMLKVLVEYFQYTGDAGIQAVITAGLRSIEVRINHYPLTNWAQFRWFEVLIPVFWLYERTGEDWLLGLAAKLRAQGFDWQFYFTNWPEQQPTSKGVWSYTAHVVNNAMAIKANALWWRISKLKKDTNAVNRMIQLLDKYHGMVTGVFSGDECLAGTSPVQGTELCAVVEYMYSLESVLGIMGDSRFADRLEQIAFNALPATFSMDMWSHQYDQQVNQVECSVRESRPWNSNGPDANIFGLEPNFGCCTANLSQGWPKFAAHLWMGTSNDGIAVVSYAPSTLNTRIAGVEVEIKLETDYPFKQGLNFTVSCERPVRFPLLLRIPAWADESILRNGDHTMLLTESGYFHSIEQEWDIETTLHLQLPMKPKLEQRTGSISLVRGPVVFALKIDEEWSRINDEMPGRELPHGDWEVYATSDWNYGLMLDEANLPTDLSIEEKDIGQYPFSPEGAPLIARVKGKKVTNWHSVNGSAEPVPQDPIADQDAEIELQLIPYGCTNLRITEFPRIK